ncbi:hypothetical protein CNR22_01155 [Sphingobacteriaceae bacterium]|nr:hypothetical protein CNR22_01155 [Sphingobacteriaceae bacterium]
MKKLFIYLALSVYAFAQLKPLAVVVEDVLAHTFWKVQHMATVHYENGHYHVHTELKDIAEKENKSSQQKIPSSEKILESTAQDLEQVTFNFPHVTLFIPATFHSSQDIFSGYTQITIPPPKA